MAIKLDESLPTKQEELDALNKIAEQERIKEENRQILLSIYRDVRDTAKWFFSDKRISYSIMKDGDVFECSKETYLDINKDSLACRVYRAAENMPYMPNQDELNKVIQFWGSLTEKEQEAVKNSAIEYRKYQSKKNTH